MSGSKIGLKRKKGQSSIEFVLIAAVMFFVFIGAVVVIQGRMAGAHRTRLYHALGGLDNLISTEIRLAESGGRDYLRRFFLPRTISGYNYSIGLIGGTEIVIGVMDFEYVIFLDQNISGGIGKGWNFINKTGGNITITNLG